MIQVPINLFLQSISCWKAFKGTDNDKTKGHRIILIHKMNNDTFCYLVVTSQIEKARIRSEKDKASLVELDKTEWQALTKNSCIECGKRNLKIITCDELIQIYQTGNLQVLQTIPDAIKQKIKTAICFSVTYTDAEKKLYTTEL